MVSDVPLTKDVLASGPNFKFTYFEWLEAQGEQIIRSNAVDNSSFKTLYTVPEGFKLYVKQIWINLHASAPTGGGTFFDARLSMSNLADDWLWRGLFDIGAGEHHEVTESFSYPTPLQAEAGVTLSAGQILLTAQSRFVFGFSGFLVRKDLEYLRKF